MPETIPAPSAAVPAPAAPVATVAPGKVAYRRLPGRVPVIRVGIASSPGGRLYLGPDHLLKIETGAVHETYKRFAFREITAINLVRTSRWHWLTGVAVTLLALVLLGLVAIDLQGRPMGGMMRRTANVQPLPSVGLFALAALALPSLLLLVTNLLRGPTCLVTLHTALGPEPLPTLGRLRVAVPVVREIAAAAEQAQGQLDAEALAARISTSLPPG